MPCNSDYLNPTFDEKNSKRVCKLLKYVLSSLGRHNQINDDIKKGVKEYYGNVSYLNAGVVLLCKLCSTMSKEEQDKIIYNGRNANARDLADWWEEHVAADKARLKKERAERKQKSLRASALKKLSKAEIRALREIE